MRVPFPSNDWATPSYLIDELKAQYSLSFFDPCPLNNDINLFNGLKVEWPHLTFVNPPYDLKNKTAFVTKAHQESLDGKTIILLLPVSTSTKLFHDVIYPHAKITFLDHRPTYEGINTKNQWVNPGQAPSSPGILKLREYASNLEQVNSPGAHDAMVITFNGKAFKL